MLFFKLNVRGSDLRRISDVLHAPNRGHYSCSTVGLLLHSTTLRLARVRYRPAHHPPSPISAINSLVDYSPRGFFKIHNILLLLILSWVKVPALPVPGHVRSPAGRPARGTTLTPWREAKEHNLNPPRDAPRESDPQQNRVPCEEVVNVSEVC